MNYIVKITIEKKIIYNNIIRFNYFEINIIILNKKDNSNNMI